MAVVDNTAHAWALKLMARGTHPATIAAWMRLELARNPRAFDPAPRMLPLNTPEDLDAILADPDVPDTLKFTLRMMAHYEWKWCTCYRGVTADDEAWLHGQEGQS